MKKIIIIIISLISLVILDTISALVFKKSPVIKVREKIGSSYVDKGILLNTYYCVNEDVVTVSNHFKTTKFTCNEDNIINYIEKELDKYISSDRTNIELSDILDSEIDKIEYFKGAHDKENMYIIVYPKNGTYESSFIKKFNKYFSDRFNVYQTYDSPNTPLIYIHTKDNNVNFKDIISKYEKEDRKGKNIKRIYDVNKILIKSNNQIIGSISEEDKINYLLNNINSAKQYGSAFLCDGNAFEIEMYNNDKLKSTFYLWRDGVRIKYKEEIGCGYYIMNDIREFIENETDYIFYDLLNYSETENTELIYKDNDYSYYTYSDIFIKFSLSNQVMSLKYAIENNYISINKVSEDYPQVVIKK